MKGLMPAGGFHRPVHGLIRDIVVLRDLAQGVALLDAVQDIRPFFGGNAVMRVSRAGASLLARQRRFGDNKKGRSVVALGVKESGPKVVKTGTDGRPIIRKTTSVTGRHYGPVFVTGDGFFDTPQTHQHGDIFHSLVEQHTVCSV